MTNTAKNSATNTAKNASKDGSTGVTGGQPLWHGRFSAASADTLRAYTDSIGFDVRLVLDDVTGSLAHVDMLGACGILAANEAAAITAALHTIADEVRAGSFVVQPGDEDVHTAIERRVTEIAGEVGGKVHTARSRNDQVATALRLFVRRELHAVAERAVDLIDVLVARANEADAHPAGAVYLPGYTHLQRAQPVLLSHHLRAHAWSLERDVARILDALARMDVSPLGAGALAGTSLPIDPDRTAATLGFARRFPNSLDAVSDRDYVAETLFALSLLGVHLSRLGEEWVLWTSEEFRFATLDDRYATGSSMLPQKKNADIAELARGKAGRLVGNLTGFLVTLKGLPLAYNRDLQEDKEPLFDSLDQVSRALVVIAEMIATATFHPETMRAAADAPTNAATDLAEWLVGRGMPFRRAHAVVGSLVARAVAGEASLVDLVRNDEHLGAEATGLLDRGEAVRRRVSKGGAGPVPAGEQRAALDTAVASLRERLSARATT
jgi:argininosuccinate lyase